MNLFYIFQEVNERHFDGFLDPPSLRWNRRLRSTAGRFIAGSRKFLQSTPCVIEIASYLLHEKEALFLIRDTLAHEMTHYWLWVRERAYGHNSEFLSKIKEMGVNRYNPAPLMSSFRYLYVCKTCFKQFPTKRKIKALACLFCCDRYYRGKYNKAFILDLSKAL